MKNPAVLRVGIFDQTIHYLVLSCVKGCAWRHKSKPDEIPSLMSQPPNPLLFMSNGVARLWLLPAANISPKRGTALTDSWLSCCLAVEVFRVKCQSMQKWGLVE